MIIIPSPIVSQMLGSLMVISILLSATAVSANVFLAANRESESIKLQYVADQVAVSIVELLALANSSPESGFFAAKKLNLDQMVPYVIQVNESVQGLIVIVYDSTQPFMRAESRLASYSQAMSVQTGKGVIGKISYQESAVSVGSSKQVVWVSRGSDGKINIGLGVEE